MVKKTQTKRKSNGQKRPNPASVYLATLAPSGRRSMRHQLAVALNILGKKAQVERFRWQTLDYADLVQVRSILLDRQRSPHTVNQALAALIGVAQSAFHLGLLDADSLLRLKWVKRVRCHSLPRGRSLSAKELRALLKYCERDTSIRGRRDWALVAVMIATGLRRAEVVALDVIDYDIQAGELWVRRTKGRRDRHCPLPKTACRALDNWLRLRGTGAGALFCRILKNEKILIRSLSTQAIYEIVQNRAKASGIGTVKPHDLRRTFVTRLLESNVDINIVRQLVGHSDVKTTCRYDLRVANVDSHINAILSLAK